MTVAPTELSKAVSHALRHEPWVYELELDEEGWVSVDSLIAALHDRGSAWTGVDRASLEAMIRGSGKRRHELVGDRVRALYGHSLPGRLARGGGRPAGAPVPWDLTASVGRDPQSRASPHGPPVRASVKLTERQPRR